MPRSLLLSIAALGCMLNACGSPSAPQAVAPAQPESSGAEVTEAGTEAPKAASLDPVKVSPEVYKVLLDGDRMRVLEATWQPGARDNYHGHPSLMAYALTEVFGLAYDEDESQVSIRIKQGRGLLQAPVEKHAFENRGKLAARMLIVEFKEGVRPAPLPKKARDAQTASPDIYDLVAFDTHVRALLATWQPGQQDEVHGHAALARYAITDVDGEFYDGDGKLIGPVHVKAGTAAFEEPVEAHSFKNTGTAPAQMLLVEARK